MAFALTRTYCTKFKLFPLHVGARNSFNSTKAHDGHVLNFTRYFKLCESSSFKIKSVVGSTARNRINSLPLQLKKSLNQTRFFTSNVRNIPRKTLLRPFAFTVGMTVSSFAAAYIYSYEKMRAYRNKQNNTINFNDWNSGQKLIIGIIAVNACIFGMWRVMSLQHVMSRYFVSQLGNPVSSMLGACFSHYDGFHIFMNMYVLWSFGPFMARDLGEGQFSAVYVSAGLVSALAGLAATVILKRPISGSVGASGCIMGLLGMFGMMYPDKRLSIALVNQIIPHSFSAEHGIIGILVLDILGLALGWKYFDHAGHLGGMIFGILYAKFGQEFIWGTVRKSTLLKYKHIRDPPK